MKLIGNILWFLFTGFGTACGWVLTGIGWCCTIIGIPFGVQAFKLARVALFPFGTTVEVKFGAHPIANVIWFCLGGFGLALSYVLAGLLWCVTIVGIPFGMQCFKLAKLGAFPFGAEIK